MSFAKEFQQIFEAVKDVIETKKIKEHIIDEARQLASDTVTKLLTNNVDQITEYPRIDFPSEDDRDELLLVLEFLQSSGYIFGEPILRYESQHPEIKVDRVDLANKLGLDSNNKEPLLVQMVRSHVEWIGSKGEEE